MKGRSAMNKRNAILVVDDSPDTVEVLQRNLSASGCQVFTAPGVEEAIGVLNEMPVDLVITDLKMPKVSGMDLIRHVRENLRDTAVMMITGHATIDSAVQAVKTGAEEYLTKPFTDDELISAVGRVLKKHDARRLARAGRQVNEPSAHGIVGDSPAMQAVFTAIEKTAATSATVLVAGESGSGKELVARAIHYSGPRASAPFIAVNCGAIPDQLVESELFGHVKGAFTGATEPRDGFFRAAHGGTIFLDEISELTPATQVKLLRVLQEGEIIPVGSSQSRKIDARILAATNKVLGTLVRKGTFREDLFFRVSVINVDIPPLRDRGNDILLLVDHLATKLAKLAGRPLPQFSDEALVALKAYSWPGNVRELENTLNRLIVMGDDDGTIDIRDLPSTMRFRVKSNGSSQRTLVEVETEHIAAVLASVGGNKTRAAEILGIDRKTLREKLKASPTGRSR